MATSEFSTVLISDQEVHLFYRVNGLSFEDGPALVLSDLLDTGTGTCSVLPEDQWSALADRYATEPIWEQIGQSFSSEDKSSKISLSKDLHPAIADLLSGENPDLVRLWRLTTAAARMLARADLYEESAPKEDRNSKFLTLQFRESARDRMLADGVSCDHLRVRLLDIQVVSFSTGIAFLIVQLRFEKLDESALVATELTEAVHAISRFNNCQWIDQSKRTPASEKDFSLGQLLRAFVERDKSATIPSDRVTSYVFAETAEPISQDISDHLCAYLARRYTSDYDFEPQSARLARVTEFSNVRHFASDEGIGTVICPRSDGKLPVFLANWKSDRLRSAYSPIVLMLLHENSFLTQRRSGAVLPGSEDSTIADLETLLDEALQFRLCFRFGSVSDISMHNSLSLAMRSTLDLDRKLTELQGDVEAVSMRLNALRADEQSNRYYWLGVFSGAALAGLTAFTIFKELFELLMVPDRVAPLADGSPTDPEQLTARWLAVILGAVVGVFSWHFGKQRVRGTERPKKALTRTKEAMRHHMIRRSNK